MQKGFTKLHSAKKLEGKSLQPSEPTCRADWSGVLVLLFSLELWSTICHHGLSQDGAASEYSGWLKVSSMADLCS